MKCPHCGYDNINIREHAPEGWEYTKCSECGCHYEYRISVMINMKVPGVG